MDNHNSNKRLKTASGAPITTSASNLSATNGHTGRTATAAATIPTASVARAANGRGSLRLTVKAPPSKLRQATSGSQVGTSRRTSIPANPYVDPQSESDATPQPVGRSARSTRNVRTIIEPDTDEDEDMEDEEDEEVEEDDGEEEDEDEDEEMEDEEVEQEEDDADDEIMVNREQVSRDDSEEDAEGEDDDEMDELARDEHPPPPVIRQTQNKNGRPSVTVTAPPEGLLKSVEEKEMEDEDDDDDELSDLESNENEGEEEENDEDDDEDMDDDDEDGSRSGTPDLSKLTRRQRAYFEDNTEGELMALSNEAQKKKHLTAEEHAMRRAEMARRRKNLSEKRNEEEKMDTINKLLKKPAPKRRTRQEILAAQQAEAMATPGAEDGEEEKPDAVFVRWVHSRAGSRIGVPDEWIEAPVGDVFRAGWKGVRRVGRLVEEVPVS